MKLVIDFRGEERVSYSSRQLEWSMGIACPKGEVGSDPGLRMGREGENEKLLRDYLYWSDATSQRQVL